jgi:hypothetical protein
MQQYTRDEILETLAAHNECRARHALLRQELGKLKHILAVEEAGAIETDALKAQHITDMPRGGGLSDPTARIACKYADGYMPKPIQELREDVREMEAQCMAAGQAVWLVDSWVMTLDFRERFAIEKQAIDGMTWREVIAEYERLYGVFLGKRTWVRAKSDALDKIERLSPK